MQGSKKCFKDRFTDRFKRTFAAYLINATLLLPIAHASNGHNPSTCLDLIGGNVCVRDGINREHLNDTALHHSLWVWEEQSFRRGF